MNNYSLEHVHYIKCIKKENSLIIFFRLLFIITLLTMYMNTRRMSAQPH